jgi:hypothetical protein
MSAPGGSRSGRGIGPAVARRDQPHFGQPEVEHGARSLADILAQLRADKDDDWGRQCSLLFALRSTTLSLAKFFEILGLAEILIDRGEADIGDAVELLSGPSITISPMRLDGNFAFAQGFDLALDAGYQLSMRSCAIDRDACGRRQSIPSVRACHGRKGSRTPSALDDGELAQLDALEGRKPAPQPSHWRRRRIAVVFGRTAVFDLAVVMSAKRATHLAFWFYPDFSFYSHGGRRLCLHRSIAPVARPIGAMTAGGCADGGTASTISLPIWRNSASPKPRVVPAGVPRRTPEVTKGFSGRTGCRSCCR